MKTSETAALMQQARLSVASLGTPEPAYPSRRSLREAVAAPVAPEVLLAVDEAPAAPAVVPPASGSRRAAREARIAAAAAAVTAVPAVPAVPVAPSDVRVLSSVEPVVVPVAQQVAAPFGTFGTDAAPAAEPTSRRAQRERDQLQREAVSRPAGRPAAATAPAASASAPARVTGRKRLSAAGTMVLVGGLFVSLTLPAYASNDYADDLADVPTAAIGAQTLALDESELDVASTVEARDGYDSTSAVELRRLYRDALRQQRLEEYLASGAMAMGDDYPWATELRMSQGGGLSPLNYFVRQCTDFVAWRLNRDVGSTSAPYRYNWSTLTPGGGNASSWKSQWERHGWGVSSSPAPGWVAWFPGQNHVGYVNSVLTDGSVVVEEYNWGNPDSYGQRIISAGEAVYLAPPPR